MHFYEIFYGNFHVQNILRRLNTKKKTLLYFDIHTMHVIIRNYRFFIFIYDKIIALSANRVINLEHYNTDM